MTDSFDGRCLCGDVRFSAKGDLVAVQCCHCRDCARWAGGAQISAMYAEGFEIDGPVRWYKSSDWGERGVCARCGAALFWRMLDQSMINAATGAFDDQTRFEKIDEHIYVDSKPAYYDFVDNAPRLTAAEVRARYGNTNVN